MIFWFRIWIYLLKLLNIDQRVQIKILSSKAIFDYFPKYRLIIDFIYAKSFRSSKGSRWSGLGFGISRWLFRQNSKSKIDFKFSWQIAKNLDYRFIDFFFDHYYSRAKLMLMAKVGKMPKIKILIYRLADKISIR